MCIQIEARFSFSNAVLTSRRTQSLGEYSQSPIAKPNTRPTSITSSSSSGSITSLNTAETKPIASTSRRKHCEGECFQEVDLQEPIIQKSKPVSRVSDVNFREVSEQTHSGQINPARDGVRARARRILLRHTAPVIVGVGVGTAVGAIGAFQLLNTTTIGPPQISTTTDNTPIMESSSKVYDDDFINVL